MGIHFSFLHTFLSRLQIGLMRNGVLVEEGSPQDILIKYNKDSLESAFLTLCYNQDTEKVMV